MNYLTNMLFGTEPNHMYSVASTGIKTKSRLFSSRVAAERYMYKQMKKFGLVTRSKWNDGHFQTFLCDFDIKFYVNRL